MCVHVLICGVDVPLCVCVCVHVLIYGEDVHVCACVFLYVGEMCVCVLTCEGDVHVCMCKEKLKVSCDFLNIHLVLVLFV